MVSCNCFCRVSRVVGIRRGHFRFQIFGLFLQIVFAAGSALDGSLLRAKFAGLCDQILLVDDSAFELGEHRIRPLRYFLRAVRKQKINSGHYNGHGEHGRETGFESAIEGEGIAGHLFGDGQRFERGVRDLLALFGDAHFIAKFIFGALHAQARTNARQQFARIAGAGNGVVRAEVQGGSALLTPGSNEQKHANRFGFRGAANRGENFAGAGLLHGGIEQQKIGARLVNGVESFASCRKDSDVVAGRLQGGAQLFAAVRIGVEDDDSFGGVSHGDLVDSEVFCALRLERWRADYQQLCSNARNHRPASYIPAARRDRQQQERFTAPPLYAR